jgi:predicted enzyme related to lactoylglutathione lyase
MPNPIVHFEIGCRDRAKTQAFFAGLFDWKMEEAGHATKIRTGGEIGGHITALGHQPQHYTIFYVQVDDVKAYLDKATSLGGKMLVPPIDIPEGTFAWFADPDGNTIGLIKPKV